MTSREIAASRGVPQKPGQSASQAPSISSSSSRKRKNNPQIKFYGVKRGHIPGVYLNWNECYRNVTGFKNASFQSFSTQDEAEAYVAGRGNHAISASSPRIEKYYAVARGHIPGIYTDWDAAQEQITGWKGPKFKKFGSRAEAEAFLRDNRDKNLKEVGSPRSTEITREAPLMDESISENDIEEYQRSKKAKTSLSTHESTRERVVPGISKVQGGSSSVSTQTVEDQARVLRIYTDGSSLGNGKNGARAGLGVFFGTSDPRNVSERLPGIPQTNQRAELAAILRALEISPKNQEVHIVTDSEYSINCVTKWCKGWEKNNWQTSVKRPVLNKDLIQSVLAKIRDREALGTVTQFFWVKGHSKDPGNEGADQLAVQGAKLPLSG